MYNAEGKLPDAFIDPGSHPISHYQLKDIFFE
jgi:hypothetical protein